MTYRSSSLEMMGANTARVPGLFTLKGVSKPAVLDVTFNGGYAGMADFDPRARIGISARGTLNRSDFNMEYGLPPKGTHMGVGDSVEFVIEAEFSGPPLEAGT